MMPGQSEKATGSPTNGEPAFLAVGKVRRPHGVGGDVLVEIYTDFPERLKPNAVVYVGEKYLPLTVRRQRSHNDGIILAFEGFLTPEQVGRFRNEIVYVKSDNVEELPDGEYYFHQLMGLTVFDEQGNALGEVTEILETGANDVYVVTNNTGRELLLPAVEEVVLDVNLETRTMKVHLLPGLLDNGDLD